jgi:hypothetical protein
VRIDNIQPNTDTPIVPMATNTKEAVFIGSDAGSRTAKTQPTAPRIRIPHEAMYALANQDEEAFDMNSFWVWLTETPVPAWVFKTLVLPPLLFGLGFFIREFVRTFGRKD